MPRIYVADLAAYNAGILHGVWVELDGKDEDEIQSEIDAMLRASPEPNVMVDCPECKAEGCLPGCLHGDSHACKGTGKVPSAEEWAVHDYEGFEGLDPGEYPGLPTLVLWAKMLAEHGEAWSEYAEWVGKDYATEEDFNESYCGRFASRGDYAAELNAELGEMDSSHSLYPYVNWDAVARDMHLNGEVYFGDASNNQDWHAVHVFRAL